MPARLRASGFVSELRVRDTSLWRVSARHWILAGCISAAIAVALGAFGAHVLEAVLDRRGRLADWDTAVRYQLVHALALVAYGLFRERPPAASAKAVPGWCFLLGSLFFSGSIYCLCLGVLKSVMGPLTPLGGLLLLGAWVSFALQALRR